MRVLHIAKFYPPYKGGMETFLRDLVVATSQQGVENVVLAHHSGAERMQKRDEFVENIRVIRVPTLFQLLYAPICFSYLWHLKALIRDVHPDVIHVHLPNLSAFWVLALPDDIPVVVHWHADVVFPPEKIVHRLAYLGYRQLEKRLLHRAARIIVTSPQYLAASVPLQDVADKCECIPLGMDETRLPRPSRSVCASVRNRYARFDSLLFLSVGRFSHYKGFHVLIEAISLLPSTLQAQFVIVGDGEEFESIRNRIIEEGLSETVTLPGKLSDDELAALLHASDGYCLPSIERTEAFGVVLLEAMAAGKPVISSAITGSGVRFVVDDEVSGLQVPPKDSRALKNAIQALCESAEKRENMGAAGRERYEELFTIQAIGARTVECYNSIMAR